MRVAKTRNMCFVCHTTFFLLNFDHGKVKVYNYTIAQSIARPFRNAFRAFRTRKFIRYNICVKRGQLNI